MPRYTIDLSEAQSFEATEPGVYPMTIDEFEEPKPSKEKGTLGTMVYFAFQDPAVAKRCGRARRWYALEGRGAGFFRELWKAATGEDLPIGEKLDFDSDDAVGRPVNVLIGNEDYNGSPQNTVEKVTSA